MYLCNMNFVQTMKKYLIVLVLASVTAFAGAAEAVNGVAEAVTGWTNPIDLPGLEGRSTGDPYIMKYRGYYYMYVSAGDEKIYCRKSKNLIDWSDDIVCGTDPVTAVAYAPEVIYWNGKFYMCTSPRGGGHYMLTADSPEGPFVHQSANLGRDIDGSMFIDDDGEWYFYHANNEGIRGAAMPTHLSYADDVDLHCCITGQWTEGPCVFKRNGLYYLVYTGNHVWTDGYRIDYAISDRGPLEGFRPVKEQNPILVDTETPVHKALGHGTAFIGPDLDSYYFVYHNLQDGRRRRLLNFERIAWSGDKMVITGPTYWPQEAPIVAVNDYFERPQLGKDWKIYGKGKWSIIDGDYLSQTNTKGRQTAIFTPADYGDYTAEFTVKKAASTAGKPMATGSLGCVFSYRNAKNFAEALISPKENILTVKCYADGKLTVCESSALPKDFDPAAWHHLRVEKHGTTARVYIDGMRKATVQLPLASGRIGYTTVDAPADFSYIAISPYVDGNGILDASLPVPGILPANLCIARSGDMQEVEYAMPVGKALYMKGTPGSSLTYRLNVHEDNIYNVGIRYKGDNAMIRLKAGNEVIADSVCLPSSGDVPAVFTLQNLPLSGGLNPLTVEVTTGDVALYDFNFKRASTRQRALSDDFSSGISPDWGYSDGDWTVTDGRLECAGKYGKMLLGGYDDIPMTDYTAECDIFYPDGEMNGGLLFRVTNPSIGGADDNPVLGTDFLQGYILMAGPGGVTLGKHNFGWQPLVSAPMELDPAAPHHLKVVAIGPVFKCYVDDMETPVITFTDPDPFIIGRTGVRAHNSRIRFDNFSVNPVQ